MLHTREAYNKPCRQDCRQDCRQMQKDMRETRNAETHNRNCLGHADVSTIYTCPCTCTQPTPDQKESSVDAQEGGWRGRGMRASGLAARARRYAI